MEKRRAPTVADVASRAGVSLGTVSNFITGAVPVSAKTRARVAEAMEELGYRENRLAQGLRSNRVPIIGVCVPDTSITYFSALTNAFEDVASSNNFQIMQVISRHDPEREYERVESLLNYRVGGLILVPTAEPERTYELIQRSGIAAVIVDRTPSGLFPLDRVSFDNRDAMHRIAEGLFLRGHRRIAFVFRHRRLNLTQRRIKALREVAGRADLEIAAQIADCRDLAGLTNFLAEAMDSPDRPTAVILSSSTLANWIFKALKRLKLKCPEDLSVVAFDEPDWAEIVTPTLSAVRQPTLDIAQTAWRFLLDRMTGEAGRPRQCKLLSEVIFRDSVANL
jgi:LacI family transcriptional regulator